ncbi:MAG: hypothetical protein H7099_03455 [Gemmatimonadaceae bacterium]|nr:hypothetical protein [Gemmatimonadaceae bacterium]
MNLINLTAHLRTALGKAEWNPNMAAHSHILFTKPFELYIHPPKTFHAGPAGNAGRSSTLSRSTPGRSRTASRGAAEPQRKIKCFGTAYCSPHPSRRSVLRLFSFAMKQLLLLVLLLLLYPDISQLAFRR